ncbi:MAG: inorganic phosphate transporter [Phycisphaeraceae bacterium]
MDTTTVLLGLTILFGFYMAWSIGANDVANAMGTSVGSGSLTLRQAVLVAAVLEFAGAFLVGSSVADTLRSKLFDPEAIPALTLGCGMIAALLAAGVWLQFASFFGWPVSTTHSIVGAVVGIGCVAVGVGEVNWGEVGKIASSWIISPILAGAISYVIFRIVLVKVFYKKDPVAAARRVAPYMAFMVFAVMFAVTGVKGLKGLWIRLGVDAPHPVVIWGASLLIGIIAALITARLVRKVAIPTQPQVNHLLTSYVARSLDKAAMHLRRVSDTAEGVIQDRAIALLEQVDELAEIAKHEVMQQPSGDAFREVERIFVYLQIISACFVAFAHGANDVANAIGPMVGAWEAIKHGIVSAKASVPLWALALGGVGIVIGLATWGWRVIETIGKRITELTPTRGFCAEFGAALTILVASVFGLPISTTHTLVGAVLGVGLARGIGALNLTTMRDIVASWIITIPAGAGLAIVFFFILKAIFVP